ncbi:MAG: hypothetical protein KC656_32915, partial [Myxococcales bacterium]|nr:hypothetical protein [Myxococcales bacterium]
MITGLVGLLAGCGVGLLVGAGIALRRPPVRVERAGADALSALDALHDGHLLTDASGRILWASQGALALLDLDVMPVDRDLVELFPGYASAGTAAVRRSSTGRALGHYHRLGFVGRNGLTRWLEASFQPLGDDLLWSFREPDREPTAMLERLEELERSSDEKRRFLTSMSHEMRTPLNAILGYTEMVREDLVESGNDAYEGDFRRILRAGRHLLEVVNAILDLAKIEA